jgi:hypothetical protein
MKLSKIAPACFILGMVGCVGLFNRHAYLPLAPKQENAEAKKFIADQSCSKVYVYWLGSSAMLEPIEFCIDGSQCRKIVWNSFICFNLSPGEHEMKFPDARLGEGTKFQTELNKIYFVRLGFQAKSNSLFSKLSLQPEFVSDDMGKEDIKFCKLLLKPAKRISE